MEGIISRRRELIELEPARRRASRQQPSCQPRPSSAAASPSPCPARPRGSSGACAARVSPAGWRRRGTSPGHPVFRIPHEPRRPGATGGADKRDGDAAERGKQEHWVGVGIGGVAEAPRRDTIWHPIWHPSDCNVPDFTLAHSMDPSFQFMRSRASNTFTL